MIRTLAVLLSIAVPLAAQAGGSPGAEYTQRLAALAANDLDGHAVLARWCRERGLDDLASRQAKHVLNRDPDHAAVRALLGHQMVKGQWMTEEQAYQALGYVRYQGRWRQPQEVRYLKRGQAKRRAAERAERERLRKVDARVRRHLRELAGSSEIVRTRARDALVAIAEVEGRPELGRKAEYGYSVYRSIWDQYRRVLRQQRVSATGIMTLSLQHTELLGIDTVPISFGNGTGGRLQLPRTRTISIGTTVAVPLGIGH